MRNIFDEKKICVKANDSMFSEIEKIDKVSFFLFMEAVEKKSLSLLNYTGKFEIFRKIGRSVFVFEIDCPGHFSNSRPVVYVSSLRKIVLPESEVELPILAQYSNKIINYCFGRKKETMKLNYRGLNDVFVFDFRARDDWEEVKGRVFLGVCIKVCFLVLGVFYEMIANRFF